MPYVYLIHLERKLCNHAGHYLGYTALESVSERLDRHKQGNGARLLYHANLQGIQYTVVRIWECNDSRQAKALERKLKKRKNAPDLCPVCNPSAIGFLYDPGAIVQSTDMGIPF